MLVATLTYLQVSIYEPVNFEIIVIFSKRVDERFRYLEPAHVEKELFDLKKKIFV